MAVTATTPNDDMQFDETATVTAARDGDEATITIATPAGETTAKMSVGVLGDFLEDSYREVCR